MSRSTNMVTARIYESEFLRTTKERIQVFNAAALNCITFDSDPARQALGGDFIENVRIKRPTGLDTRNDTDNPTSTASVIAITQGSGKSVILQRRLGPTNVTRDEKVTGYKTKEDYSAALGQMFAEEQLVAIRNRLISAAVAAVDSADTTDGSTASANIHILDVARDKVSGSKVTCTKVYLNRLLAKMRDAREDIKLFVMDSTVFADLVGDAISQYKIDKVAGVTIYEDVVQAFGRAVLVMDAPALSSDLTSSYYTEYAVLGLGVGALRGTITDTTAPILKEYTDLEVLHETLRQDYNVEIKVDAMKWNGVANPSDAVLATASSWDEDYEDHKDFAIVKGIFNGT